MSQEREASSSESNSGLDRAKRGELTEIVHPVQCRMVSMPECSDAKVVRLVYTNSGVGILALSSNGIQKLWKWSRNEQNPSGKATTNCVPQHWQTNSGLLVTNAVAGVSLEEVVPCIALSEDDSYVVSAGRKVQLFSIMTFEVMKTIMSLPSASTFLAFHPHDNGIIAIGMEESTIYIYFREDDEDPVQLRGHQKRITGLAFSTELKILVSSGADAQLCVWSTRKWTKRGSVCIQLAAGEVPSGDTQLMFHADQLHLLVTHETQLAIYHASEMERILHQWIPQGSLSAPISSATYSCNSQLVYASFKDGNIGVLDADTLTLRCCIAPSAYLSNRSQGSVYPLVIAAHPQEPNQLAVGLTNGSVQVIQPLESVGEWGVSPPLVNDILNDEEMDEEEEEEEEEEEDDQMEPRKKVRLDKGKAPAL